MRMRSCLRVGRGVLELGCTGGLMASVLFWWTVLEELSPSGQP